LQENKMAHVYALTNPAPIFVAPNSATLHVRATVTGSAAVLTSFAALPTVYDPQDPTKVYSISDVYLGVESASSATKCYYRLDGGAPTAALGFELPVLPNFLQIPVAPGNLASIQLFSAGTTYVQVWYQFKS
jgi:hypothetical protein